MLSQTSEYALRAMACLAMKPGESMTAGALASTTKVPPDYLAKVLQQLGNAGLIRGRRGVGGGYSLSRDPKQIRLTNVLDAVTSLRRIETCPLGLATHGKDLCPLHRTVDNAIAAAIAVFDDMTLHDLISKPGANVPLCESRTPALTINGAARKG